MEFFMHMKIPNVTHQQKRITVKNGKPVVYEDDRLKDARNKFLGYLYQYRPEKPMEGPVMLYTMWIYPLDGKHKEGEWKTTKPDLDNLVKLFQDCMTEVGFWKDDAQVVCGMQKKWYGDTPGIYVMVHEIVETVDDGGDADA